MSDLNTPDARTLANRKNAAKSTGPRTPEGKSRSRQNSLKHGLSVLQPTLLPPDMEADFQKRLHGFLADICPQSQLEAELVRRLALAFTRAEVAAQADLASITVRRNTTAENFEDEIAKFQDNLDPGEFNPYDDPATRAHYLNVNLALDLAPSKPSELIPARYESMFSHEINRTLNQLLKLRKTPLVIPADQIVDAIDEPDPQPVDLPASPLPPGEVGRRPGEGPQNTPTPTPLPNEPIPDLKTYQQLTSSTVQPHPAHPTPNPSNLPTSPQTTPTTTQTTPFHPRN